MVNLLDCCCLTIYHSDIPALPTRGSYWLQEPATTRGHIPGALKLLEKSGFLPPVFNYEGTIRDRRRQKTPFVGLASTAKGMIELGSGHTWGKVVVKASDVDPEDHESWMAKL